MSLADIVTVSISSTTVNLTQAGFGTPLIVSHTAAWTERTRTYADIDEVADDWATTTPEYLAAAAIFAQEPSPTSIKIGRAANKPTTQWKLTVKSAASGETYRVAVNGETYEYAADDGDSAGSVTSSDGPFTVRPAEHWDVSIDQGTPQVFAFSGTQGYKVGSSGAFAGSVNGTVVVRVNEDSAFDQTVIFTGVASGLAASLQTFNNQLVGVTALASTTEVKLVSDRYGTSSTVRIVSGTALLLTDQGLSAGLGTAGTATCAKDGGGPQTFTCAFLDAMTATEAAAGIVAAGDVTGGSITADGAALVLTTDTGGASPKGVQVKVASSELLGFDTTEHNGEANGSDNDSIVNGLVAALPSISGFTVSAQGSGGSKYVRILADAADASWARIEVLDPALLTLWQNHADPGIATDLAAIELEDSDWYGLVTLYNSYSLVLAAAGWVESAEKLYSAGTADTTAIQDTYSSGTTTDIASKIKAAGYARTAVFYHPDPGDFADAALFGRFLPKNPGSETWRTKPLQTVTVKSYTSTYKTNLHAKNAAYFYTLGGVGVVGGKGMVGAGEYIDVIRFRDWWVARTGERLAALLIGADKVPYTDSGIAQIEAEVRAQNAEGIKAGGIAEDPAPVVTVPKASAVSGADKASRTLNNVNTTWTLAGAIHSLAVRATISA